MDTTTTWIVFGLMMVGGIVYGIVQFKGMKQRTGESGGAYLTRMYGESFTLRPGEQLTHMSFCSPYRGKLMPGSEPGLGREVAGAAARAAKKLGAAAVGIDLSYSEGTLRIGLTNTDRLVVAVERGEAGNFVPESWSRETRVQTDLEAFGTAAEGGPPATQGGLSGTWVFVMLSDEEKQQQRGLWVDAAFLGPLKAWSAGAAKA